MFSVKSDPFDWSESRKTAVLNRVADAKVTLNAWVPFFGHLTLGLKPRIATIADRVPSAAVTLFGDLILNVDYVEDLSQPELRGLLCHEVMHPALLCFQRRGNREAVAVDPKTGQIISVWNLAHDFALDPEIDEFIRSTGQSGNIIIPDATINPAWKGWSAEEIYEELLSNARQPQQRGGGQRGQRGQQEQPGQQGQQQQGQGGQVVLDQTGGKRANDARGDLSDQSGTDGGESTDPFGGETPREASEYDSTTADEWRIRVLAAVQVHKEQAQANKGKMPAGLLKQIREVTEPRIEWIQVLSMWAGENGVLEDYTYRRPSRRSHSVGEYLPSRTNDGVDEITVFWDSSGSMNGREEEIMGDIQGICEDLGVGIRVIIGDAAVQGDVKDVTEALEILEQLKGVPGGGGSNFLPLFKVLEDEQYRGVVVAFTDGHITVPPEKPDLLRDVLWVINDNGSDIDPTTRYGGAHPWGCVLHVDNKGNGRLSARA